MQDFSKSEKYNEDFDKQLNDTRLFTKELIEKFYDAYSYDTATTHNWLVKKLKIIQGRLAKGDKLPLETMRLETHLKKPEEPLLLLKE